MLNAETWWKIKLMLNWENILEKLKFPDDYFNLYVKP